MVLFVETLVEFNEHLNSAGSKLVIVDFTASWCGPCRFIGPIFEKMAEDNPDVVFLKVDVDKGQEIAETYGIQAMPTFIFFKNGQKVADMRGADENKLKATMNQHK